MQGNFKSRPSFFSKDLAQEPPLNTKTSNPFSEAILHQLWQQQLLPKLLTDLCGDSYLVMDTGQWNHSDGPDFLGGCLRKEHVQCYGSIEFHLEEEDWFRHGHHTDALYDSVIAHLFIKKGARRASGPTKAIPIHICLEKQFPKVASLLLAMQRASSNRLPCQSVSAKIDAKSWNRQLHEAGLLYLHELQGRFEQLSHLSKVEKLLVLSWEHLGVPHNRTIMRELAEKWLKDNALPENIHLNTKGLRPRQHLKPLLPKLIGFSRWILDRIQEEDTSILVQDHFWQQASVQWQAHGLSKRLLNRIERFVWLPFRLYMCYSEQPTDCQEKQLIDQWMQLSSPLPENVAQYFEKIDLKKTGPNAALWVAQQRFFCEPRRCTACKVFKSHF